MNWNRTQRWAWAAATTLALGCGAGEEPAADTAKAFEATTTHTAALTEVNAVRPNAAVARSNLRGVPDDVNLVNDVKDTAGPDFDSSYVEGNGSSSYIDLAYPIPATGDSVVTYVNLKYFVRNAQCTVAPCGQASSALLKGTTVIATSSGSHNLPDMTQGWYLFNDTYTLTQPVRFSELRTRIYLTWPGRSTFGMRMSSVAADFHY